jgi:segregation and condensation protein B
LPSAFHFKVPAFQNQIFNFVNQEITQSEFSDEPYQPVPISDLSREEFTTEPADEGEDFLPLDEEPKSSQAWDSDPVALMKRVESVLFLSRKPLSLRKISDAAFLEDATQARTIIGELNARYDRLGQSFHIKTVAGGYQMLTRPQFSDWVGRLEHLSQPLRLSAPAMETLTVVAYRQPIIKAEIEAIRGVACGEMLRQLLEFNLVKIAGRSEKLGRPFLYTTTKEFLTLFGLSGLQELPRAKELSGIGLPEGAINDNNLDHLKYGSNAAD